MSVKVQKDSPLRGGPRRVGGALAVRPGAGGAGRVAGHLAQGGRQPGRGGGRPGAPTGGAGPHPQTQEPAAKQQNSPNGQAKTQKAQHG